MGRRAERLQQMQVLLRKVRVLPCGIPPDYASAAVPQYFGGALTRAVQMFDGELTQASSTLVRLAALKRPGALLEPKLLGVFGWLARTTRRITSTAIVWQRE